MALLCSLLAAGCDLGATGDGPPRRARVTIVSENADSVMLLTSIDFIALPDGTVDTGGAVATSVTLPFEVSYNLLDPPRLLVRITPADPASTAAVSLDVFFDGELFASQSDNIGGSGNDAIEFLYRFIKRTL